MTSRKVIEDDARPPLGVAHVVLETDRMDESAHFMRTLGMRPISEGSPVSVYEMRGGTHLILMLKSDISPGNTAIYILRGSLFSPGNGPECQNESRW